MQGRTGPKKTDPSLSTLLAVFLRCFSTAQYVPTNFLSSISSLLDAEAKLGLIELSLVPPRGRTEGLKERNKHNGAAWKSLDEIEQKVFSSRIFFSLAGLPDFDTYEDWCNEDLDETDQAHLPMPTTSKLTPEEESLYRPIYERLVDQKRVEQAFVDGLEVSSATNLGRKGLQSVRHLNAEVKDFLVMIIRPRH